MKSAAAIWLFAGALLLSGMWALDMRYERKIARAGVNAESFYRRTAVNERIVAHAAVLARMQAAALADLRTVSRQTSLSRTTADVVTLLERTAARHHLTVLALQPSAAAPAAAEDGFAADPLTIKARGHFRDILGFVADLPHHRTLVGVSDTQLDVQRTAAASAEPMLEATIHTTLYRLRAPAAVLEERRAAHR